MSAENRMGWNDEIDSFTKVYMYQMGKVVYDWATAIMKREGKVIDKIDDRIAETEKEIKEKTALGLKLNKECEDLEKLSSKTRLEWQKLIEEASRYKTVANKYIVEKDYLEKMTKGSKEYKAQETRLKGFEPKYLKWKEITEKTNKKKEDYQEIYAKFLETKSKSSKYNVGKLSLLQYVKITLAARLENLKKEKSLLEGATAVNMAKHRNELKKAFSDQRAVNDIAGMIVNSFNSVLQGQLYTNEFSEDQLLQLVEDVFKEVSRDKVDHFNFLRTLAEDPRNYTIVTVDGKKVKVFDMDKISTDDMLRVFSGWFRESIVMTVNNILKKLKQKQKLFVSEQSLRNEDEDDDGSPIDNMRYKDDDDISVLDEGNKRKKKGLSEEKTVDQNSKDLWRGIEPYLDSNVNQMTNVIVKSLQKQLPQNAYYIRIGASKAKLELLKVVKNLIRSCGNEIRNGSFIASTKLRNFVKSAIGGVEDGAIFNIIYSVIRATVEYYILDYMAKRIISNSNGSPLEYSQNEIDLLRGLEIRKDISKQALRDCRLVKYASRINKIATALVNDFEDNEELFEHARRSESLLD